MNFLIQNVTRFTTNDSKTDYLQNFWSKKFFIKKKNNFFRNNFSNDAQKSQLWRFFGVNWPDKLFFGSQFSKKNRFSNHTFFIEDWCVVNILTQVLTLCWNALEKSTTWKKFVSKMTRCKVSDSKIEELFKVGLKYDMFSKSWFKVWCVV